MKAKKILSAVLTLGVIATCGFVGCGKGEQTAQAPLPGADKPSVEQYDGTIMQAGGTYGLTSKMAFMSDTTNPTSDFEAINTEIVATVYPADADQRVRWSVKGFESSTAWTQGKSATDYVSISTDANDSKRANVKCLAPFAEQIIIECASVENPSIKSSCTLDFVQAVKDVRVVWTNQEINIGGVTNMKWEINQNADFSHSDVGPTGVYIECFQEYTLVNQYDFTVDLISPEYFETGVDDATWGDDSISSEWSEVFPLQNAAFNDGYFNIESSDKIYDCGSENLMYEQYEKKLDLFVKRYEDFDIFTKLDSDFLEQSLLWMKCGVGFVGIAETPTFEAKMLSDYSKNPVGQLALLNKMTESSLYTFRVTVTGKGPHVYTSQEFCSLINVAEFTNTPVVKSVTLSETSYKF